MKQFDMRRFGLVLKLDFAEGIKPLLWNALLMVLVYLFFFWGAWHGFYRGGNSEQVQDVCMTVGSFACIAMYIYFLASVNRIFRDVQQKQKLTTYLMLPATNFEKFLSRWIYILVFSIAGGILALLVADAIHAVYLLLSGLPVHWATGFFINVMDIKINYRTGPLIWLTVYSLLIFIHAFALLGGVLFRRYHFVATGAVFVSLVSVWAWLMNVTGMYRVVWGWSYNTIAAIEIGVFTVGIVVLTCLSYWLFCRYQVITRKLVNL